MWSGNKMSHLRELVDNHKDRIMLIFQQGGRKISIEIRFKMQFPISSVINLKISPAIRGIQNLFLRDNTGLGA